MTSLKEAIESAAAIHRAGATGCFRTENRRCCLPRKLSSRIKVDSRRTELLYPSYSAGAARPPSELSRRLETGPGRSRYGPVRLKDAARRAPGKGGR